jgi:hypothetical protein
VEQGPNVVRFIMLWMDNRGVSWRADIRQRGTGGAWLPALGRMNVESKSDGPEQAMAGFTSWARGHGVVLDAEGLAACAQAIWPREHRA